MAFQTSYAGSIPVARSGSDRPRRGSRIDRSRLGGGRGEDTLNVGGRRGQGGDEGRQDRARVAGRWQRDRDGGLGATVGAVHAPPDRGDAEFGPTVVEGEPASA